MADEEQVCKCLNESECRPSVPLIRLHGSVCSQGPAHRTSRAFRPYKAPRTQVPGRRRAGNGDGEGEEVEGEEYLETMQQRSALWRELSACVVRPAAVMAMLLLVLHAPHSALSQWPICYDHFVPDKIGPAKKPGPRRATALPPGQSVRNLKLCHPRCPCTHAFPRLQAAQCGTDKLVKSWRTLTMGSFRVTIPLRGT